MTGEETPWPALLPVLAVLERLGVAHHVGGSVASSLLAVSRATQDVDLVADLRQEHVAPLVAELQADYYIDEEAVATATRRRSAFNVVHLPTMFKVDVFVAGRDPFTRRTLERTAPIEIRDIGRTVPVSSPEDVVLRKLEWYAEGGRVSERQWKDVQGVLRLLGASLDRAYLDEWARKLGVTELLVRALEEAGLG